MALPKRHSCDICCTWDWFCVNHLLSSVYCTKCSILITISVHSSLKSNPGPLCALSFYLRYTQSLGTAGRLIWEGTGKKTDEEMGGNWSCLTFWACSDTQREISLPSGEGWGPHPAPLQLVPGVLLRAPGWALQCILGSASAAGAITACVCQSWVILLWEGKNIHCKPQPEHHWSGRTAPRSQENEWFIKGSFDLCQGHIKHLLFFWLAGQTGHVDIRFSHLILHYLSHSERVSVSENVLG